MFNKSLKEKAHRSWSKAIITSIYKKGIRNDPGNYRPVSLTSVIAKVMESLVRDAILSHLIQHDVLSDCQHGFVPGRDCITQPPTMLGGLDFNVGKQQIVRCHLHGLC